MPKQKVDYSKTVIYKIVCNDLNVKDVYVGSTTDYTRRKAHHKHNSHNANGKAYNFKLYQFIRNNGDWENFDMIEIEKYPCNDKREAELRERHYFELLNANLNIRNPSRTKKEWFKDNEQKIKDKNKKYRENNKTKILLQNKEYYEVNKAKINDKNKEYYEVNKAKIDLYRKEMFECNCGGKYSYCHKARHINTKKHQDYLTSLKK